MGALCMLLFGFGWAKPVPIDPRNFKKSKGRYGNHRNYGSDCKYRCGFCRTSHLLSDYPFYGCFSAFNNRRLHCSVFQVSIFRAMSDLQCSTLFRFRLLTARRFCSYFYPTRLLNSFTDIRCTFLSVFLFSCMWEFSTLRLTGSAIRFSTSSAGLQACRICRLSVDFKIIRNIKS